MDKKLLPIILAGIGIAGVGVRLKQHKKTHLRDIAYTNSDNCLVYILENGTYQPYIVLTDNYAGQCLLLRLNVLDHIPSDTDSYLNTSFLKRFSHSFRNLILDTDVEVTARDNKGKYENVKEIMTRKVFLLSRGEVDTTKSHTFLQEGDFVSYFSNDEQRAACTDVGKAMSWWLRTPSLTHNGIIYKVGKSGAIGVGKPGNNDIGIRPAFCLDGDTRIYKKRNRYVIEKG